MRHTIMLLLFMLAVAPALSAKVLGDITIPRKGADSSNIIPQAIFPHWKHRTRYKCYACHDKLFKMQAGANNITMDAVQDGQFCGLCHDGKTAFAVGFDTCERCHLATAGGK